MQPSGVYKTKFLKMKLQYKYKFHTLRNFEFANQMFFDIIYRYRRGTMEKKRLLQEFFRNYMNGANWINNNTEHNMQ